MLGRDLAEAAAAAGFEVLSYDLPEFDVTDPGHLRTAVRSSDIIVNCAAYTNVDMAEMERDLCRRVNSEAPGELGEIAKIAGKYVLHVSTDFVFGDRTADPLDEKAPPCPLGCYGATKLEGEKGLAASGCRHCIIRIEWTYGRHGRNFVSKIAELAKTQPRIAVVDDQIGAPTWTCDVSRAVLRLAERRSEGIYHFAAAGYASRHDAAKLILRTLGLRTEVTPCATADFKSPAPRPLNSRFDCSKIDGVLGYRRPAWDESLVKFLKEQGPSLYLSSSRPQSAAAGRSR